MRIEDLKDSRDRDACERAQRSSRYAPNGGTPSPERFKKSKNKPTLSQMDQKAASSRRVAYDDSIEREFQSGRPVNVRSDVAGWNVLPRP